MKQYEKYKPTGIEWIGDIPSHWDVKPIKYLLKKGRDGIRIGPFGSSLRSEFITLKGVKVYGQENIINDDFTLGWRFINEEKFNELSDYEIKSGDLLVTMMGTTGKCKVVPKEFEKGIMDSHLIRLRIDNKLFLPQLCADLINSSYYLFNQIKLMSKGSIMEGLNSSIVKNLFLLIPSLEEQITISNFLDDKTAQIDSLIFNKQQLISFLKEERSMIINDAVSGKGKNWEQKKLKYVMDCFDSIRVPLNADQRGGGEKIYDYYGASGAIDKVPKYLFDGEYILIGEDGANLLTRSTALAFKASGKFWVNNHAHILKPKVGDIDYYTYLLESIDYTILVTGSAQPKLTAENLMNIALSIPPIKEQNMIVRHITIETERINNIISKIEREIELMQEYRISLISEVVTGKIKVI